MYRHPRRDTGHYGSSRSSRSRESTRSAERRNENVFDIIKVVGAGAEGTCQLLRRARDGKTIICKTPNSSDGTTMDGDTPREVRILRDILRSHPRIIEFISYKPNPGRGMKMYYEYCSGGDLWKQCRRGGGSSEALIWHVFKQMAEALAYLHHGYDRSSDPLRIGKMPHKWQPIVHCDLKPGNIFLSEPRTRDNPLPDLVLGDFGVAVVGGDRSGCGTPGYKPPEYPVNDPPSDIWALGCTVSQMGRGCPPVDMRIPAGYRGTTADWMLDPKNREIKALPASTYSKDLSRVMLECLQVRPDERITAYDLYKRIRKDGPR